VFGLEQSEVGEGCGFGFEGGDGFDEAGDGEGVADAALAADQAQDAAFAGELDGDAHERGDAGAVDLRDAVQEDDNFLRASFDHGFESVVEQLGRLADGDDGGNLRPKLNEKSSQQQAAGNYKRRGERCAKQGRRTLSAPRAGWDVAGFCDRRARF